MRNLIFNSTRYCDSNYKGRESRQSFKFHNTYSLPKTASNSELLVISVVYHSLTKANTKTILKVLCNYGIANRNSSKEKKYNQNINRTSR